MEDGVGRIADSMLVPVMCSPRIAALALDDAAASESRDVSARVERALLAWRDEARRTHAAFTSKRLGRERVIAALGTAGAVLLQPGLFDRRAQSRSERLAAANQEESDERAERLRRIAQSAIVVQRDANLLLALTS